MIAPHRLSCARCEPDRVPPPPPLALALPHAAERSMHCGAAWIRCTMTARFVRFVAGFSNIRGLAAGDDEDEADAHGIGEIGDPEAAGLIGPGRCRTMLT
jgi:hypothetical protein